MLNESDRRRAIRSRAYALWEQDGGPFGDDWAHWFRAEAEINSAYSLLNRILDATVISNRAFVSIRNIESEVVTQSDGTVIGWRFNLFWQNGGNTPTKHLTSRVTYAAFMNPIELGFEFPDMGTGAIDYSVMAPQALRIAQIYIPSEILEKVNEQSAHAYIWGWANYNDVFIGTPRHRTEFCVKVVVNGDPKTNDCKFSYPRHHAFNDMDDECVRNPKDTGVRGYYKFLDSADIDKILIDGTLIVSGFQHFRDLEASQWGAIADPLDGASELKVKGPFIIRENSPELDIVNKANIGLGMSGKFAEVSDRGCIDISDASFVHHLSDLHIFSMSFGEIAVLTEEMCVNAERPYDACLQILDVAALRRRIFDVGTIRSLNCKVSDVFEPGWIQPVEYEAQSRDIREGGVIVPSPFKKDPKFKPQAEVRMLFVLKQTAPVPENRLIIDVPDLGSLFEEVFRNYNRP